MLGKFLNPIGQIFRTVDKFSLLLIANIEKNI